MSVSPTSQLCSLSCKGGKAISLPFFEEMTVFQTDTNVVLHQSKMVLRLLHIILGAWLATSGKEMYSASEPRFSATTRKCLSPTQTPAERSPFSWKI